MTTGTLIGLDVGGTSIKAVRIDGGDRITRRETVEAGGQLAREELLDRAAAAVRELAGPSPIVGVGIAVGGLIRADGSMPRAATNLPQLAEVPLVPLFTARLGARCTVLNDAHAAMHGEAWLGAAMGLRDVLLLTLGTGIGGGLMLGGEVRAGAHGSAGEIGAWPADGGRTFEAVASAVSFERRTGARLGDAIIAGTNGDEVAVVLDAIGRTIAAAHALLDLEACIIGGSVASIGEPLRAAIEAAVRSHCPAPFLHDLKIITSALGSHAGAIGAVAPALRKH